MSRYIDADAFIADMQERYCKPCKERKEDYNEVRCRACWVDDAIGDVDGFADNAIDAVSVVRCKECKHYKILEAVYDCEMGLTNVAIDDYCSYGERSDT